MSYECISYCCVLIITIIIAYLNLKIREMIEEHKKGKQTKNRMRKDRIK